MPLRHCLGAVLCVCLPLPAGAVDVPGNIDAAVAPADPAARDWAVTAYWENDSPYFKPNNDTDRQYTNGVALGLAHQPQWAQSLAPHMPFADSFGPARTGAGYLLGQLMFTPDDLARDDLIEDDRPYAGYLFGSVYWQRANQLTLDHFQLELGLVGPASLAEDSQEAVHEMFADVEPRGWEHQLHDEITFQCHVRKKWRLDLGTPDATTPAWGAQLLPQVGVALGTVYRHLDGGALLRLGLGLPDDFGPGRLADVGAATAPSGADGWGAYGFVRTTGRVVEHDLFLDGNTFRDSHGVDVEPLVGELQLGLAAHWRSGPCRLELTYSQTYSTDQFTAQDGTHAFGAWTLSFHYTF